MAERVTILWIGQIDFSQETTCLLLHKEGFEVTQCTVEIAPLILKRLTFDLIMLSHDVTETDRLELRAAVDERTKIIQLDAFTYPSQLLELIRREVG